DTEYIPGREHVFQLRSYCYDIEKGREFSLKDLIASMPGCRETILRETNRQLREMGHGQVLLDSFDTLIQKGLFYYDEYLIYIFFDKGTLLGNDSFFTTIDISLLGDDFFKGLGVGPAGNVSGGGS
ncbi:MAG: hypothetical protein ACYDEQ_02595, partial [Desulfocucumaceae bacterium]